MICLWKTTGAESKLNTAGSDSLFTNGCRSEFSYKTHTYISMIVMKHCVYSLKKKTGEWNTRRQEA